VIYLLVGIVLLGDALRATYFNPDIHSTPDERTYTHQDNMMLDHGVTGFRILGQELAQNPAAVPCYVRLAARLSNDSPNPALRNSRCSLRAILAAPERLLHSIVGSTAQRATVVLSHRVAMG